MPENKNVRRRGITLKTPEDARRLIRRIVDRAFKSGEELVYSGRLAQLLNTWLRAWELERITDLEARISNLERIIEQRDKYGDQKR